MSSKILRSFRTLDVDGETLTNFSIKFLEPNYYEQALDLMVNFFIPDEAMCRSKKVSEYPAAVENCLKYWRKMLEDEKLSIGCFKIDGEVENIVGVNILCLKKESGNSVAERDVNKIVNSLKF